jgi:hypothetical protein
MIVFACGWRTGQLEKGITLTNRIRIVGIDPELVGITALNCGRKSAALQDNKELIHVKSIDLSEFSGKHRRGV